MGQGRNNGNLEDIEDWALQNKLISEFKTLGKNKTKQNKANERWRKKVIHVKTEINQIEAEDTIKRINKSNIWFSKEINAINKIW